MHAEMQQAIHSMLRRYHQKWDIFKDMTRSFLRIEIVHHHAEFVTPLYTTYTVSQRKLCNHHIYVVIQKCKQTANFI